MPTGHHFPGTILRSGMSEPPRSRRDPDRHDRGRDEDEEEGAESPLLAQQAPKTQEGEEGDDVGLGGPSTPPSLAGIKTLQSDYMSRVWAAAFYAAASLSTVFVMKVVLTSYAFPSALFLALAQVTLFIYSLDSFDVFSCRSFFTV